MAYFWEDKIADVTYANPELDTVKILWKDDDDIYREHYLKVDEEDDQFRALLDMTSYDDIEGRTKAQNDIIRQEFKAAFDDYAKRTDAYTTVQLVENINQVIEQRIVDPNSDPVERNAAIFRFLFNFDPEDAENKESLFSLKLSAFEKDEVKDSEVTDRTKSAKTGMRKSIHPLQVLAFYNVFVNENAEIHKDDDGNITGVFVPFT